MLTITLGILWGGSDYYCPFLICTLKHKSNKGDRPQGALSRRKRLWGISTEAEPEGQLEAKCWHVVGRGSAELSRWCCCWWPWQWWPPMAHSSRKRQQGAPPTWGGAGPLAERESGLRQGWIFILGQMWARRLRKPRWIIHTKGDEGP